MRRRDVRDRVNPFPQPTALQKVMLRELVKSAALCYEHGWSHGRAGNFSVRGSGGLFWQSPAGTAKAELDPALFVPMFLETVRPATPVSARPSNETAIHAGIYRVVPAAKAIVHSHPPYLVAASRAGADLVFQGEEMQKHLGCRDHHETVRVPVAANPRPENLAAMAHDVARYVKPGIHVIVLAGHGAYAWGATPSEALGTLETLEFLCRTRNLN
jgi:methylthioribulose-1-phosphate dehydratase